ncbi:MAG: hypothetical protein E7225_07490 [Clostridiales bacterium]|nr:hypothetical protein [Clostridiales bacterium]
MLRQALSLWKKERKRKETTLHRRLILFFVSISIFLILAFALLLMIFGITGKDEKTVETHINTELTDIAQSIEDDFAKTALDGISIAESISRRSDMFFLQHEITPGELAEHPELIEPLLAEYMETLINTVKNSYCGGTFVLLDATVLPDAPYADTQKAGVFLKKTQPLTTEMVGVKIHCLRGPAQLARDNGIMLLGQWRMEFNTVGEQFFEDVMETAKNNPVLPISRLYYWSGRVVLEGNSESGFLLCVPLRSSDGTVFGVCGIEVSDRLFKQLYSPEGDSYDSIFTAVAPLHTDGLGTSRGMIAGNYYLTGNRLIEDLTVKESRNSFEYFSSTLGSYGGKSQEIKLYPHGSPYEDDGWSVAILMPEEILNDAIEGNLSYFIYTIIVLLFISLIVSVVISRYYLKPVKAALDSIQNNPYDERQVAPYLEINDLFEFLASKDREYEETLREKEEHSLKMKNEYEQAQREISRLAYLRKTEIDPDAYSEFLESLSRLTKTEREIFNLYIAGKSAREIMDEFDITENTLKYHNRNIYSKLGVTSRKELLRYAALLNEEQKH